jgi:hypothetical protein
MAIDKTDWYAIAYRALARLTETPDHVTDTNGRV